MKRIVALLFLLLIALPSLARAQNLNVNPTTPCANTTIFPLCQNTTGTLVASNINSCVATGNTVMVLPPTNQGCLDWSILDFTIYQPASHSYTLNVRQGVAADCTGSGVPWAVCTGSGTWTGTSVNLGSDSNGGFSTNTITTTVGQTSVQYVPLPAAASGITNYHKHDIWVYAAPPATPQWTLVTQETNPAGELGTTAGMSDIGGIAQTGSSSVVAIGTPSAPSIVSGFTSGTTDYYFCVAGDVNATTAGVGTSIPSSGTGTTGTTGTMSCGGQTGAMTYYLLRKTVSTVPSGSASTLVGSCTTTSGVACNVADANNSLTTFVANISDLTGVARSNSGFLYQGASLPVETILAGLLVSGSQPAIWLGIAPSAATGSNYAMLGTGTANYLGAPSGGLNFNVNNATEMTISTSTISFNEPATSGANTLTSTTGAIGPTGGGVLQSYGGTLPTCACTGGSPTCVIATGGDNTAGQLQLSGGTAVTTCTLTFSASGAFHAAPICGWFDANASITPLGYSAGATSTTTAVVDFAAATATNINYHCIGK